MSFEDTFSILDKINLIKQYLTGNVIMSSENLEGNKREKKKDYFPACKKESLSSSGGNRRMFSLFSETLQDSS